MMLPYTIYDVTVLRQQILKSSIDYFLRTKYLLIYTASAKYVKFISLQNVTTDNYDIFMSHVMSLIVIVITCSSGIVKVQS